jgi:hypothetical protein
MCNSLSPTEFVTVYQTFQRSRENYKILGEHKPYSDGYYRRAGIAFDIVSSIK